MNNQQGIKAKKSLGQNFLISEKVLKKIINSANIQSNDFILEIGPGTGNLTKFINAQTDQYLGIEKDKDFQDILKPYNIVYQDALQYDIQSLPKKYKVIANIPYYITSPLINLFLKNQFLIKNGNPPEKMVILIQKEVAEKICTNKLSSFLSTTIHTFATTKLISSVKKGCFRPIPKVDSAIIEININKTKHTPELLKEYFRVCSICYANPRKQMKNNLINALPLTPSDIETVFEKSNIDINTRADKLQPDDFINLTLNLQSHLGTPNISDLLKSKKGACKRTKTNLS